MIDENSSHPDDHQHLVQGWKIPGTFSRKEVERITGIPARRISFYTESGVVEPDILRTGRGRERRYSRKNLFELLIIKELAGHRVELSRICSIMNTINIREEPPFNYLVIYRGGYVQTWRRITREMVLNRSVFIVNVKRLVEELACRY